MENRKFGGLSFEDLDRAATLEEAPKKTSEPSSSSTNQFSEWVQPAASPKPAASGPMPASSKPISSDESNTTSRPVTSVQTPAPSKPVVSAQPKSPVSAGISPKTAGSSSSKSKQFESAGFRRHKYGCIGAMIVGVLLVIIGIINYANTLSSRGDVLGPMFFVLFAASVFSVGVSGLLLTKIMDPTGQTKGTLKENIKIVRTTIGLSLLLGDILFGIFCFTILNVIL